MLGINLHINFIFHLDLLINDVNAFKISALNFVTQHLNALFREEILFFNVHRTHVLE